MIMLLAELTAENFDWPHAVAIVGVAFAFAWMIGKIG